MIAVVNYGLGNVRAFANVYKRLNMPCTIASESSHLERATRIILPGVGAFDQAMKLLEGSGMRKTLDRMVVSEGIPVLGVCVGMQILAKSSEEGKSSGLGWVDGAVRRLKNTPQTLKTKLPHMGWNEITPVKDSALLAGLVSSPQLYFLHSYAFHCNDQSNVLATTEYGDRFSCVVSAGHIYGVQFHPEKSHQNGIQILKNFGLVGTC